MKIFVSGGGGMVGRNVLEHSAAHVHQVWAPPRAQLDLSNRADVLESLKKFQPDLIIHAAGKVGGIQANINEPVRFLTENLDINRNLIGAANELRIKKFLNLSSSCVYPRGVEGSLNEEMILQGELEPTNEGYALAKVVAMKLCEYISRENRELQFKTLIPCNLFGRFDHFDPVQSHLIPAIIMKMSSALKGTDMPVEIWGDGTARREFMYAGDLADFIWKAIDRFDDLPQNLNVGLGYDYSINEYYEAVGKVLGFQGRFQHDLSKPVGMKRKLVSVERLEKFGWRAPTSLEQGLLKTIEYYQRSKS